MLIPRSPRSLFGAALALAPVAVYVLVGVLTSPSDHNAAEGRTAPLGVVVDQDESSTQRTIDGWIDYLAPGLGVEVVYDGDTACVDWALGCVRSDDHLVIHFDVLAFDGFGTPSFDTPEDEYLLVHELAHVLTFERFGRDGEAIADLLTEYGFGGQLDYDGAILDPLESLAECFAFANISGVTGNYVETCPASLQELSVEILR